MATKRKSGSEPVVSSGGAAARPARKSPLSHAKRTTQAASETAVPVESGPETDVSPEVAAPVEQSPVIAAVKAPPDHEAVAALAYSYWLARGCQGGSAEEDWLRAEQELKAQ